LALGRRMLEHARAPLRSTSVRHRDALLSNSTRPRAQLLSASFPDCSTSRSPDLNQIRPSRHTAPTHGKAQCNTGGRSPEDRLGAGGSGQASRQPARRPLSDPPPAQAGVFTWKTETMTSHLIRLQRTFPDKSAPTCPAAFRTQRRAPSSRRSAIILSATIRRARSTSSTSKTTATARAHANSNAPRPP